MQEHLNNNCPRAPDSAKISQQTSEISNITEAYQSSTSFTAKQQNKGLKNAKIENFMVSISEELKFY
ncbi:unnamed protein product [Rhizophagus irregularis]|nr:unnamed protein product [Rhizophagus irregularis]